MDSIMEAINIENDFLYKKGEEKGEKIGWEKGEKIGWKKGREEERENKNREFVSNLIQQTEFSDTKIADLATVSIQFVQKIRTDLNMQLWIQ
jgi:flagellar biosynthesis/type III secretory pathway protein FliH